MKQLCAGPKLLDLGDILYAPTIFRDASGRCLMVAWLQELRKGGAWDYAGCLSMPRRLSLQGVIAMVARPRQVVSDLELLF